MPVGILEVIVIKFFVLKSIPVIPSSIVVITSCISRLAKSFTVVALVFGNISSGFIAILRAQVRGTTSDMRHLFSDLVSPQSFVLEKLVILKELDDIFCSFSN